MTISPTRPKYAEDVPRPRGRFTSDSPSRIQLVRKRGKPILRFGLRVLGLGAVVSLGIDLVTWLLTREGNIVRLTLGLILLGAAGAAIGIGALLDAYDRRKLNI